jgi:hypothetical protein
MGTGPEGIVSSQALLGESVEEYVVSAARFVAQVVKEGSEVADVTIRLNPKEASARGTLEFVGCAIALSGFGAHLNLLREGRWKPESRSSQID